MSFRRAGGPSGTVCYYPEQWDESFWAEDLRRMKEAGLDGIRIAEFAWNRFEPEEGVFTFAFFDRFLEYVEAADMKVVFCTPTATPPAWMTHRYPEVLNADIRGDLFRHGARRHYNYNSPVYREFCSRIVEQLGKHYGQHPRVVGWQIDNELNCETGDFYSESDHAAFREFLKEKYGTLDRLNFAWGTDFWNQTYSDWDQVYGPRPTVNGTSNPHQKLDYIRFISASALSFCRMQSEILRKYKKPGDYITTNGIFGHMDNAKMVEESLDTYMYDSYPGFAFALDADPVNAEDLNDRKWSRNLTETRSVCPHFGIMEQQSGSIGWNDRMEAPAPKPGQMMLWAMQSIAHGADYVSFFRWRTSRIGTEIYWHGILDYDSRDNRRLEELRQIARRTERIRDIAGAEYQASFALLKSCDNQWDAERDVDSWHSRIQSFSENEIFCGAQLSHTPMDVVWIGSGRREPPDPERYPLLILPHAAIVAESDKSLLEEYVKRGGILCMGCRTGYKNEYGHCVTQPMPGLLRGLAGGTVEDFTSVRPEENVSVAWRGKRFRMPVFNDMLEAEDADVLAVFEGSYYDGKPAILEHSFGKGKVLWIGGVFTRELTRAVLEYAGVIHPFADWIDVPEDCEIAVRKKGERRYLFVLNYMPYPRRITLHIPAFDPEGNTVSGEQLLSPYEAKIYIL